MLTVVYRKNQEPQMQSLSGLQYELQKSTSDFKDQYTILEQVTKRERVEIVQLTHTPRNIGQINIQILWYIPARDWNVYTYKEFENNGNLQ